MAMTGKREKPGPNIGPFLAGKMQGEFTRFPFVTTTAATFLYSSDTGKLLTTVTETL